GTHTFTGVMHRTNLAGQQSRTALLLVVCSDDARAAEGERRGGHTRNLQGEAEADEPEEASAKSEHDHKQLNTRFLVMMVRGLVQPRSIQFFVFVVSVCLLNAALAA